MDCLDGVSFAAVAMSRDPELLARAARLLRAVGRDDWAEAIDESIEWIGDVDETLIAAPREGDAA
jgi:hypothetical protein